MVVLWVSGQVMRWIHVVSSCHVWGVDGFAECKTGISNVAASLVVDRLMEDGRIDGCWVDSRMGGELF